MAVAGQDGNNSRPMEKQKLARAERLNQHPENASPLLFKRTPLHTRRLPRPLHPPPILANPTPPYQMQGRLRVRQRQVPLRPKGTRIC
jgi:hypothetical protein